MTKTILYLHPHFTLPGGAGRYVLETARILRRRGWNVHVASIAFEPSLIADYRDQISFHTLGGPLSNSLWYWTHLPKLLCAVKRYIAELRPDMVFSQVFPANWWGFIAARQTGRQWRHIWMCPEPSAFIHSKRWIRSLPWNVTGTLARLGNPLLKRIDVSLAQTVDGILANSEFTRQQAMATYGYIPEQLGISYPGVDTSRFRVDNSIPRDLFTFVTCARLTKFKNIDRILKALHGITDPRVRLKIIGNGEEYQALRSLTTSLQMDDRVTFSQTLTDDEMITAFQSSVALVHAAEEEPFGLTPVEAMACGTPVIAIRGGGPAETVVHGETGYLCASPDEQLLRGAMMQIVDDVSQGKTMQAACSARAECFTWERATDAIEQAYIALSKSL